MSDYKEKLRKRKSKLLKEIKQMEKELETNPSVELFKQYNLKLIDLKTIKSRLSQPSVSLGMEPLKTPSNINI